MKYTTFEQYWREYARLDDLVTNNLKLEENYKSFARKIWNDAIRPDSFETRNSCCCETLESD